MGCLMAPDWFCASRNLSWRVDVVGERERPACNMLVGDLEMETTFGFVTFIVFSEEGIVMEADEDMIQIL